MEEQEYWLETARMAADAAAEVHLAHTDTPLQQSVRAKGRSDFVSEVDLQAQQAVVDLIVGRHPSHRILGEEEALGHDTLDTEGFLWIVDPLDGTTNFLHGHPYFASSVALALGGSLICGAVTAAVTSERWWAARGSGAWFQGPRDPEPRRITVSTTDVFGEALVGTGFPFKALETLPRYRLEFDRVLAASAGVRRAGAAALDLCYLACGRLDAFWETHLAPWDVAAGLVIVEEAGGVHARPDGSAIGLRAGGVIGANAPPFLTHLRSLLASAHSR